MFKFKPKNRYSKINLMKWIPLFVMLAMGTALYAQQQGNRGQGGDRPNRQGQAGGQRQARGGGGGARPGESGFVGQMKSRDADKSGTLSLEEVSGGRMGMRESLFKAVDLDGDGQINMAEAKAADKIDKHQGEPKWIEFEGKKWNATHAIGAEVVDFKGKQALHIVGREQCLVYLPIKDFTNGTIEVDAAGDIFTGIGFRVREAGKRSEKVYFRPQNAGGERHQNTVQYSVIGREDGHWSALRRNFPGKYESGANIKQGEWFRVKLVIKDETLKVYANGDLVLEVDKVLDGVSTGAVGVWGWDSYFANFKYTKE